MLKLSTDALSYAHAIYSRREREISVDRQNQLRHILIMASDSNPRIPEITDLLYEKHRLLMLAKVESYLTAYSLFGVPLDTDDMQQISNELLNITHNQLNYILSLEGVEEHRMPRGSRPIDNVPQYLMDRFHTARDQAMDRLRAGRFELIAEGQKRSQRSINSISIGGDNYGPIQQSGTGNIQSTVRNDDEAK